MRFPAKCKLEGFKLSSEPNLLVKAVKFIANTIIHFMSVKSRKKSQKFGKGIYHKTTTLPHSATVRIANQSMLARHPKEAVGLIIGRKDKRQ